MADDITEKQSGWSGKLKDKWAWLRNYKHKGGGEMPQAAPPDPEIPEGSKLSKLIADLQSEGKFSDSSLAANEISQLYPDLLRFIQRSSDITTEVRASLVQALNSGDKDLIFAIASELTREYGGDKKIATKHKYVERNPVLGKGLLARQLSGHMGASIKKETGRSPRVWQEFRSGRPQPSVVEKDLQEAVTKASASLSQPSAPSPIAAGRSH